LPTSTTQDQRKLHKAFVRRKVFLAKFPTSLWLKDILHYTDL